MKLLYFDCFNGASGDMILGALLDAGLPLNDLRRALGSLGLDEYDVVAPRVLRAGLSATQFQLIERTPGGVKTATDDAVAHVHGGHDRPDSRTHAGAGAPAPHTHGAGEATPRRPAGAPVKAPHAHRATAAHVHRGPGATATHAHGHRTLAEILTLIERSALSPGGRARARHLFERLAKAEAAVHEMPVERVHLHEVGALDSIIDVVGAVFAIEWFGAERIVVSPMNVGTGMVRSAHGVFPVPAPATVRLLGDAPVYSSGVQAELLTPTGALLLTGHADAFGPMPSMRIEQVGYGAGTRELPDTPNVLRVLVGESGERAAADGIVVIECEIDDMNPQIFGVLMDRLYATGALEVYFAAVQMKKNRPGTLVTVLAPPDRREALTAVVFRETTTIGIRYHDVHRERLDRAEVSVDTPFGPIRFKVARRQGAVVNAAPEFDDCVRAAAERGAAVKDVQAAAMRAWLDR
jgi:pyridinium-3,5-bisthiocarboxylic acid mononucleotide nickel chelatase